MFTLRFPPIPPLLHLFLGDLGVFCTLGPKRTLKLKIQVSESVIEIVQGNLNRVFDIKFVPNQSLTSRSVDNLVKSQRVRRWL